MSLPRTHADFAAPARRPPGLLAMPCRTLLAVLALLFAAAPSRAGDPPFHETVLDNGLRVTVVEAPGAAKQGFLTLLPMGLLSDDPGQTQWSHLLEHFILRSTSPGTILYEVDGILVNGETTALALRLETFASPDRWRDSHRHHVEWLRAGGLAPSAELDAMLEREKGVIAREVEGTSMAGATHKWAMAAWNQVVRHGAIHVSPLGDVERASTEEVITAVSRKVPIDGTVHIVSVGPVPVDEVLAAIRADFGGLTRVSAQKPPAPRTAAERLRAPTRIQATWDLPVRQYMEWYPLPDRDARDRMAADVLALAVNTRIQQRQTLASLGVQVLASADLVLPEGRWLLISAAVPAEVDVPRVRAELQTIYESLGKNEIQLLVANMGEQIVDWPDFDAIREEVGANPEYAHHAAQLQVIEAQQTLFLLYAQGNMGLDLEQLAAYPSLTADEVMEFAVVALDPERMSTLVLEPKLD